MTQKTLESKLKKALTDSKKSAKSKKVFIGEGVFLYVDVKKTKNTIKWRQSYRTTQGKRKDFTFGDYPQITLKEVREKSMELHKLIFEGVDPNIQKMAEKSILKDSDRLLKNVAEKWMEHKISTTWRDNLNRTSSTTNQGRLNKYILPHLGDIPVNQISRAQIDSLIKTIETNGTFETAKRVLSVIRQILDYSIGLGYQETNPADKVKLTQSSKTKEPNTGYSYLPFSELNIFFKKLNKSTTSKVNKIHITLLALTMTRPGETRNSTWDEFDLNNKVWSITAERMKKHKEHIIPLSDFAISLLDWLKSETSSTGYVFKGHNPLKPISDNTIRQVIRRMGYTSQQLTPHGFRKTASTYLNEKGFNADHIEMQLAHVNSGVRGVYNKAMYLEQRREMLEHYSNKIEELTNFNNKV